jgi:hypothetical protein
VIFSALDQLLTDLAASTNSLVAAGRSIQTTSKEGISIMRMTLAMALLALATFGLVAASRSSSSGDRAGRFVVHEWGTFTSFSGSDGVKLEFRPLADVDLPPFVVNRPRQAGSLDLFSKGNLNVLQRMETPVTYFYTDRPLEAKVRIDFPQGLLTEFFPPVENMEPAFDWERPEKVSRSALDWGKVWLIPQDCLQANVHSAELGARLNARILKRLFPAAAPDDHYARARETDSDLVYVERAVDPKHPQAPQGGFFEKFLFYRGVGNFELPLRLSTDGDDRFELRNLGPDVIRSLFLVTVDGDELRFRSYAGIGAGERLTMVQSTRTSSVDELCQSVTAALVAEKLYEKEALAMVNTWRNSWFGEQGTRLFYLLPAALTNEILPLAIEPQPAETVRVMVGRMEIMRPADETWIMALVKQSAQDRDRAAQASAEAGEAQPYALPQAVIDLGRLAEPALTRVKNISQDAVVRAESEQLLFELRQYREALTQAQSASR